MAKKSYLAVAALVLTLALSGCGGSSPSGNTGAIPLDSGSSSAEESTSEESVSEEVVSEESVSEEVISIDSGSEEPESEETNTEDIETEDNVFEGIAFPLPARWVYGENSSSSIEYFYAGTQQGLPMAMFTSEDSGGYTLDEVRDPLLKNVMAGFSADEYTNLQDLTVAGYDAIVFDVSGSVSGISGDFRMLVIDNGEELIEVMIGVSAGEDQDLLSDVNYIAEHAEKSDAANTYSGTESSGISNDNEKEDASTAETAGDDADVSQEYKNALAKAESYNELLHMSRQGLYDQLTSEYGEGFSADAAQYAVDHVNADWKENALIKAKEYYTGMSMSKSAVYDQLVSEYGEQFTEEEAQYAIDHLDD